MAPAKKAVKKAEKKVEKKVEKKEVKAEAAAGMAGMKPIGKVSHFFGGISVAAIELKSELKVGDTILIKGATTDIKQKIESMQIENTPIQVAKKGQIVGMKVKDRVREHDLVYKA